MTHATNEKAPGARDSEGPENTTTNAIDFPTNRQESKAFADTTARLNREKGLWTKQISLGPRAIGWPADEAAALNVARISGKTDDEIRELVKSLHTKRKDLIAAFGV